MTGSGALKLSASHAHRREKSEANRQARKVAYQEYDDKLQTYSPGVREKLDNIVNETTWHMPHRRDYAPEAWTALFVEQCIDKMGSVFNQPSLSELKKTIVKESPFNQCRDEAASASPLFFQPAPQAVQAHKTPNSLKNSN